MAMTASQRQARWLAGLRERAEAGDVAIGDALILARRVLDVRDAAGLERAQRIAQRVIVKWGDADVGGKA